MKTLHNQKGQMFTEAVLLIALLLVLAVSAKNFFQSQQVLQTLVQGPWKHMAGLIECGNWVTEDQCSTANIHPNDRGLSFEGTHL